MRMEVDGMAKDPNEKRRRSLGRSVSNLEHSGGAEMQENAHENGRNSREAEMLAERVVAIDKEMKMLKEALAQRNGELQTARLMCSKTATRLSVVEEELDRAQGRTKPKGNLMLASDNENSFGDPLRQMCETISSKFQTTRLRRHHIFVSREEFTLSSADLYLQETKLQTLLQLWVGMEP